MLDIADSPRGALLHLTRYRGFAADLKINTTSRVRTIGPQLLPMDTDPSRVTISPTSMCAQHVPPLPLPTELIELIRVEPVRARTNRPCKVQGAIWWCAPTRLLFPAGASRLCAWPRPYAVAAVPQHRQSQYALIAVSVRLVKCVLQENSHHTILFLTASQWSDEPSNPQSPMSPHSTCHSIYGHITLIICPFPCHIPSHHSPINRRPRPSQSQLQSKRSPVRSRGWCAATYGPCYNKLFCHAI